MLDRGNVSVENRRRGKKNKMNQGNEIFEAKREFPDSAPMSDLRRLIAAVASARGTIQRARANFTVVPMIRASCPYLAAAPTTELVS